MNIVPFLVNYLIRPPLTVLGYLLEPVCALFGFSDKQIALRNQGKLEQDIRNSLSFLFDAENGRVVPNQGVPFPPAFDYAFVTVAVDDVIIRFCRGRGDLDIQVAPQNAPNDLHDLSVVLPPRLADLVLSCVAPDPNDRCASLAAFHQDLVVELRACETQSTAGG